MSICVSLRREERLSTCVRSSRDWSTRVVLPGFLERAPVASLRSLICNVNFGFLQCLLGRVHWFRDAKRSHVLLLKLKVVDNTIKISQDLLVALASLVGRA